MAGPRAAPCSVALLKGLECWHLLVWGNSYDCLPVAAGVQGALDTTVGKPRWYCRGYWKHNTAEFGMAAPGWVTRQAGPVT